MFQYPLIYGTVQGPTQFLTLPRQKTKKVQLHLPRDFLFLILLFIAVEFVSSTDGHPLCCHCIQSKV